MSGLALLSASTSLVRDLLLSVASLTPLSAQSITLTVQTKCLNLMLSSLVFHSAGGRASQAGRAVQDVKQVSGDGGDKVPKLGLV